MAVRRRRPLVPLLHPRRNLYGPVCLDNYCSIKEKVCQGEICTFMRFRIKETVYFDIFRFLG